MISDPKCVYAEAEAASASMDRFTPVIWSLVNRFARSEAEALQIFADIQDDLRATAGDINDETVAHAARRRLLIRVVVPPRRTEKYVAIAGATSAPLTTMQQEALTLGGSVPQVAEGPENAPHSLKNGSGRPGLMKLRAALGRDSATPRATGT